MVRTGYARDIEEGLVGWRRICAGDGRAIDRDVQRREGGRSRSVLGRIAPVVGLAVMVLLEIPLLGLALAGAASAQVRPLESSAPVRPSGRVDRLVFSRLEELGIQPARLCSDPVFVRRVYLDLIGTLPTPQEVTSFLDDRRPDKRHRLTIRLMEREEFADYWAMRWSDLLRVRSEFPINLWPNAVQAYHHWIRTSIRENIPYDRFVRRLLTSSGSNFRVPEVNFYRAVQSKDPESLARVVALTFMGVRAEGWPSEKLSEMARFFSRVGYKSTREWKEEIVYFDPTLSDPPADGDGGAVDTGAAGAASDGSGAVRRAVLPDGTSVDLPRDRDPRRLFADWLITPENRWFARNAVNRIWSWLLGRGIVEEADDFRADNPPSNPELLDFLAERLVAAHWDLREIYRLVLDSTTYQLSSVPASDHLRAAENFAFYPVRRLEAEVLIDALCQITGTRESYSSAVPEPWTFVPETQRAIQIADASITSSFLEMFGRPPRDSGFVAERASEPTPDQELHLLNSSHIRRKIEQSRKLGTMWRSSRRPLQGVRRLYLTVLSRYPTPDELEIIEAGFSSEDVSRKEAAVDLAWALINSSEFLYRH